MMKIFLTILLFFITTLAHGQTGPVTIHGQSFYDISDEQSLEQARIQCKQSATINAIKAYLRIFNPDLELNDTLIDCISENLFAIDVVEENVNNNELFMRIIASTDAQALSMCTD